MVELPRDQIGDLCRSRGVTRLELFGSATTDQYDTDSDYDFFVEFTADARRSLRQYFRLKTALEDLLGRWVDLVERGAVINKIFLRATEHGRQLVCVA